MNSKSLTLYLSILLSILKTAYSVEENLPAGFSSCGSGLTSLEARWDELRRIGQHRDVTGELNRFLVREVRNSCPNLPADANAQLVTQTDLLRTLGRENFVRNLWQQIPDIANYRVPTRELALIAEMETALGHPVAGPYNATQISEFQTRGQAAQAARQSTCSNVDNRRSPLEEVRNQGSVNWCYAYSAADLLSHRYGQEVSAVDVANNYNRTMPWQDLRRPFASSETEVDRGTGYMALNATLEHGFCLEEDMPSSTGPHHNEIANSIRELEQLVEQYREYINLIYDPGSSGGDFGGGRPAGWDYDRDRWQEFATMISQCYFSTVPSNTLFRDLFPHMTYYQVLDVLHHTTRVDALNDFAHAACPRRNIEPRPSVEHAILQSSPRNYFNIFDEQLNNGSIASVGYQASILSDVWAPPSGQHVSSIVGRRFNPDTGSCQYLIRNSWGPGCNYDSMHSCEAGNIWVNEDRLAQGIYEASWLE